MKTAKLFQYGQHQAVALPKEFQFEGSEVYIRRVGDAVVLLPANGFLETLFASLDLFSVDFLEERDQPDTQSVKNFDWDTPR